MLVYQRLFIEGDHSWGAENKSIANHIKRQIFFTQDRGLPLKDK